MNFTRNGNIKESLEIGIDRITKNITSFHLVLRQSHRSACIRRFDVGIPQHYDFDVLKSAEAGESIKNLEAGEFIKGLFFDIKDDFLGVVYKAACELKFKNPVPYMNPCDFRDSIAKLDYKKFIVTLSFSANRDFGIEEPSEENLYFIYKTLMGRYPNNWLIWDDPFPNK